MTAVALAQLGGERIGRAQALVGPRLAHVDRHAPDPVGQLFARRKLGERLLGVDGCDDRAPAGKLVAGDLVARAHREHTVFRQPRDVAGDRVVDLPLALLSHGRHLRIVRPPASRRSSDEI